MKKASLKCVWIMFFVFIIIFTFNMGVSPNTAAAQRIWLVLDLWSAIMASALLIKNKLPHKTSIAISFVLALLVYFAYVSISLISFSSVKGFFLTFLSALAIFSTLEKLPSIKLSMLKTQGRGGVLASILLGLVIGFVWGAINYLIMRENRQPALNVSPAIFLVSLSPAIYEELACRTLYLVFCLHLLNGEPTTKWQKFSCWFMMIVPHVMLHTPNSFLGGGIIAGLIDTVLYIVIFGLPFAILQRKRDVGSAMIAHGLVDAIRFSFFGLPF